MSLGVWAVCRRWEHGVVEVKGDWEPSPGCFPSVLFQRQDRWVSVLDLVSQSVGSQPVIRNTLGGIDVSSLGGEGLWP